MVQLLAELIFHLVSKWAGLRRHRCITQRWLFQLKHLSYFDIESFKFTQKNCLTHFLSIFAIFQQCLLAQNLVSSCILPLLKFIWYKRWLNAHSKKLHRRSPQSSAYSTVFNPFLWGQPCKLAGISCKRHQAFVAPLTLLENVLPQTKNCSRANVQTVAKGSETLSHKLMNDDRGELSPNSCMKFWQSSCI